MNTCVWAEPRLSIQKAICVKLGFTFICIPIAPKSPILRILSERIFFIPLSFIFLVHRSRAKKSQLPQTGPTWNAQGWHLLGDSRRSQSRELIIEDLHSNWKQNSSQSVTQPHTFHCFYFRIIKCLLTQMDINQSPKYLSFHLTNVYRFDMLPKTESLLLDSRSALWFILSRAHVYFENAHKSEYFIWK